MGPKMPMDVDWEDELGENSAAVDTEDEVVRRDIEGEGEVEGEVEANGPDYEDDDIGDENEEGEGEALEDPMEVEDEELRNDAKGLDEPADDD